MSDIIKAAEADSSAIYALALAFLVGSAMLAGAIWFSVGGVSNSLSSIDQTLLAKQFVINNQAGNGTGTAAAQGQTAAQQQAAAQAAAQQAAAQAAAQGTPVPITLDLSSRPVNGAANAKATLVEFSEFLCPYCIRVHPVLTDLESKYSGKMNLVHMNFIIHGDPAKLISEGAECAGDQGKYYQFQNKAFDAQGSGLDEAGLVKIAGDLGLDTTKFKACVDSGNKSAVIDAEQAAGNAVGVGGTPSFVIFQQAKDDAVVSKLKTVAASLSVYYQPGQNQAVVVQVNGKGYGIFFAGALPEAAFQQVLDAETS